MKFTEIARWMDSVQPATRLSELLEQHNAEEPLSSFAQIVRRHEHPDALRRRFLAFNTFLMDTRLSSKPAVRARDSEIGRYTSEHFDLVCLSEVWHEEGNEDILQQWPAAAQFRMRSGGRMGDSAGLLTISRNLDIVAERFYEFKREASPDYFAGKGCLLTVIRVPTVETEYPTSLLIYNTHLQAGSNRGQPKKRVLQIAELARFIADTRDRVYGSGMRDGPRGLNGVIVSGDFNVNRHKSRRSVDIDRIYQIVRDGAAPRLRRSGNQGYPSFLLDAIRHSVNEDGSLGSRVEKKSEYEFLRDLFRALDLTDLWQWRNGSPGHTSNMTKDGVPDLICRPAPDNPNLCDDSYDVEASAETNKHIKTLDYIFVSPNTEAMGFTMDFSRPRRPRTIRNPDSHRYDRIQWFSDHLGLTTEILISPRV